jgi:hypothetical protein
MLSKALTALRDVMRSSHNRIVLVAAPRGTGATVVPFLFLRWLAHPIAAMFTTIAGLNTSMADSGGPYRRRGAALALSAQGLEALLQRPCPPDHRTTRQRRGAAGGGL